MDLIEHVQRFLDKAEAAENLAYDDLMVHEWQRDEAGKIQAGRRIANILWVRRRIISAIGEHNLRSAINLN